MKISFIIPIFNRPDEMDELLHSLTLQHGEKDFEVIVVEDGSSVPCKDIVEKYQDKITIRYCFKPNTGSGPSRNYGMDVASGDYFIFLDSDTIIPPTYFEEVKRELSTNYVDAFGGPDAADEDFSDLQKAITFSMTSFLTTGGIRGGKKSLGKFQPRSFNMGISRKAYELTNGFSNLRAGEDPDLTFRMWKKGLETRLFPNAKVYHKRRSTLKSFSKQVFRFGTGRPILNYLHPEYKKITFWLPSIFVLGVFVALICLGLYFVLPIKMMSFLLLVPITLVGLYFFTAFNLALFQYKSIKVAFLALITTAIQLFYYGYGFLFSNWKLHVLKLKPEQAFPKYFNPI